MKVSKKAIILITIVFILFSLCCDRTGNLTEKETKDLYVELKQDIQSGRIWTLEPTYFHKESDLKDHLGFLKTAMDTTLSQEDHFTNESGIWYSRKSESKVYSVQCQLPVEAEGSTFTIEKLTIAKYYNNGNYKIWLYYQGEEPKAETSYIEVVFSPSTQD